MRWLVAALLVGLVLRALWGTVVPVEPISDSFLYREFAVSIAQGRGFSYLDGTLTAYWPVGTSAVYSVFFRFFPNPLAYIVGLNVAVGVAIVALTYDIARRAFSMRIGLIAAALVACWPLLIQFTTVLASELLFVFLILLTLSIWMRFEWSAWKRGVLWGGVLCAAIYVRPTALPLLVLLPLCEAWRSRSLKRALISMVVATSTAAALLAPWVMRNQDLLGKPVLVSSNFGTNLWMGNNPKSNGGYMDLPPHEFSNEAVRDRHFRDLALQFIRENPLQYVHLAIKRFVMTHDRETIGVAWNESGLSNAIGQWCLMPLKLLSSLYWWSVALLATGGAVLALWLRRVRLMDALVWIPMLFVAVPVMTVGQDRYHIPIDPFAAIFAAFALDLLLNRTKRPRYK
jgi:4-amino-4-deoxy-L-arabinose transferase-like glycosyltransferase